MSALTGPLLAPADLVITPVADLPPDVRSRLVSDAGCFAVTRPRSRVRTKILDAEGVALLEMFRTPRGIADGILAYSLDNAVDPEQTLIAAYPFFKELVGNQLLVPPDSDDAAAIEPTLAPGKAVDGFQIERCVSVLADSEVYQVRGAHSGGALKIARRSDISRLQAMLAHEARILQRLDGNGAPKLLGKGLYEGRPYLVADWRGGMDPESAAAEYRRDPGPDRERALLDLFTALADVYAGLHGQNVVHGDVHSGNLILGGDGRITILDFGWSALDGRRLRGIGSQRGGVLQLMEPEYARAIRGARSAPAPTTASDQYSLAALIYRLATGNDYLNFSLYQDEVLRQIAEDHPLPFSAVGARSWPGVERLLARALAKSAESRFRDVAEFAEGLTQVAARAATIYRPGRSLRRQLLSLTLRRLGPAGSLLRSTTRPAPHASIYYGAAGTVAGLRSLSKALEDPRLSTLAELWWAEAVAASRRHEAFTSRVLQLHRKLTGTVSVYHTRAGLYYLQALLADDWGDSSLRDDGIRRWLALARHSHAGLDLTLGRAGTLLHCALLLELTLEAAVIRQRLLVHGRRIQREIMRRLTRRELLSRSSPDLNLGVAHGWAGILYAMLRWTAATGGQVPAWVEQRLHQLADCAELNGKTARWRWIARDERGASSHAYMAGWCNGSAGMVSLWTLAHQLTGTPLFLELAEGAAWDALTNSSAEVHLCCGIAGQGYAMLNLYRHTGEPAWRERAAALADEGAALALAGSRAEPRALTHSLYRGVLGIAVLIAELEQPEDSGMPLFERGR